jgi:hypothetical protein
VNYYRNAVTRQSHVELNAVSAIIECARECRKRVLWRNG